MFKKLHFQLTLFCSLVIALILTVMSAFYMRLASANETAAQFSNFQQNMNYILQELDEQKCISHTWLNKITDKYGLYITILDNGTPLLYQSGQQKARDYLPRAIAMAETEFSFSEDGARGHDYATHLEFQDRTITGTDAFFSVAFLGKGTGLLTVAAMLPAPFASNFLRKMALPFLLSTAAAILLLCTASFFLIGHLIKPLIKNQQHQVEFFASASHELRSPLTVITAALAAAENSQEEKKAALLSTAQKECGRMGRLVNDMFTLACLDHGAISIHPEEAQLENLLIETYEKFLPVFTRKNIGVQFMLPNQLLPPCCCDPERMRQLISILLDNAGAYTPAGGKIKISLEQRPKHHRFFLTVSDNGPGIPDAKKEQIFQRFYRCDQSRTDKNHFGLGLGIAKEIVCLHQGRIQVTDTPGGGASFQVMLPEKIPTTRD